MKRRAKNEGFNVGGRGEGTRERENSIFYLISNSGSVSVKRDGAVRIGSIKMPPPKIFPGFEQNP